MNFVKIGEYAICTIDLGMIDAPALILIDFNLSKCVFHLMKLPVRL